MPETTPSSLSIVTASWPVVVVTYRAALTEAHIRQLIDATETLFGRRERFAMITDTRSLSHVPGPVERRKLGEWLVRPEQLEQQRRWSVGHSSVVTNPVVRGALQAIYWIWTPPNPQHVARDPDEAWAYVGGQLASAEIALPRPLHELRSIAERDAA